MALPESDSDALPRALIADPRAVADRWPEPRMRLLAHLSRRVTETPWALRAADHAAAAAGGLDDEQLLHAVALSAFFGHLNRIADAVDVPLDYPAEQSPPHAEPATPPLSRAPAPVTATARLALADRPATTAALEAWRSHVMDRETATLDRTGRSAIRHFVASLLGGPAFAARSDSPVEQALLELAERVTLAPWRLDDSAYRPLRAVGFDDAALFDAIVVASTAGVIARIDVALRALAIVDTTEA